MHGQLGVWQLTHDLARTAGMIEVDVGDDDVIHFVPSNAFGIQFGKQEWNRIIGADIDESRTPALDDQMAGIKLRPMKAGVDGRDAVFEIHGCVAAGVGWPSMIAEPAAEGNAANDMDPPGKRCGRWKRVKEIRFTPALVTAPDLVWCPANSWVESRRGFGSETRNEEEA